MIIKVELQKGDETKVVEIMAWEASPDELMKGAEALHPGWKATGVWR